MRATISRLLVTLTAAAALSGCQKPDVGASCSIRWNTGGPVEVPKASTLYDTDGSDYFETGNTKCDDLVCIISPAAAGSTYGDRAAGVGYCSKPCVSNQDCYESETGLVCDLILPDEAFLATLDEDTRARYLGEIQSSSYCVVPRQ